MKRASTHALVGTCGKIEDGDFVQPSWPQLAGYPDLKFHLGHMISVSLVPGKGWLDLALFLVLHGGFQIHTPLNVHPAQLTTT
jgi:hypothetical protein